jgi:adenylate cyclase
VEFFKVRRTIIMMPTSNSASADRLEKLIKKRMQSGSDKKAVDEQIWNVFGEEWSVVFTDLSGFSRRVAEFGIVHFIQTIYESLRICVPIVEDHDGLLLKTEGDSMLIIFRKPERALRCCIAMMDALAKYNANLIEAERVLLCIGVGFGKMLRISDTDVFGAEVNAASKLGEDTARSRDILVTGPVQRALKDSFKFKPLDYVPPGTDSAFKLVR